KTANAVNSIVCISSHRVHIYGPLVAVRNLLVGATVFEVCFNPSIAEASVKIFNLSEAYITKNEIARVVEGSNGDNFSRALFNLRSDGTTGPSKVIANFVDDQGTANDAVAS